MKDRVLPERGRRRTTRPWRRRVVISSTVVVLLFGMGLTGIVVRFSHTSGPASAAVTSTTTSPVAGPTSMPQPSSAWIAGCLVQAGFSVRPASQTVPQHAGANAVAVARRANAVLAQVPAFSEFVDVSQLDAGPSPSIVQREFTRPIWAVGFSELHVVEGAQGIGGAAARFVNGMVVIVNDVTLADLLVLHCDG